MDWVFPRMFQGSQDPTRPDDVEFVFTADGRAVVVAPENRFPAETGPGARRDRDELGKRNVRDEDRRTDVPGGRAPGAGPEMDVREGHAASRPREESRGPAPAHLRRESSQARRAAPFLRRPRRVARGGRRRGDAPGPRAPAPRGARRRRRRLRTAVAPPPGERPARRDRPSLPGDDGPRSPRALADRLHGGRSPSRADGRSHDAPGRDVRTAHAADRRARRRHEGLDLPLGARDPLARC